MSFTLAGDTLYIFWVNTYSFRSSHTLSMLHHSFYHASNIGLIRFYVNVMGCVL